MSAKKLVFLFILLSLLFFNPNGYAQNSKSGIELDKKEKIIDSLISEKKYSSAEILLNESIEKTNPADFKKLAHFYNLLSRCNHASGKFDLSKEMAEEALKFSTDKESYLKEEARAYVNLANYFSAKAKHNKSLEYNRKNLRINQAILPKNNETLGICHLNIATDYLQMRKLEIGGKHLDSANVFLEKNKKPDLNEIQRYHLLKGNLLKGLGKHENAINEYEKVVEISKRAEKPNWKNIATAYSNTGGSYYLMYKYNEAISYLEKSQKIYEEKLEGPRSGMAYNYWHLGSTYSRQSEYIKALDYNKKSLNFSKGIYGEIHPRVGLSYAMTAGTYNAMKDREKALDQYNKALDIFLKTVGEKHTWVISTYENMGLQHYGLDNYESSLNYYEKAMKIGKEVRGADHILMAHMYTNIANTLGALNRNDEAIELYHKAIEIQLKKHGVKHPEIARSYSKFSNFYYNNNQIDKALIINSKIIDMYQQEIEEVISSERLSEFNILLLSARAVENNARYLLTRFKDRKNSQDLVDSNNEYKKALIIVEKMRGITYQPSDRTALTSHLQSIPQGSIETEFLLYKLKNSNTNLENALYNSEKNKAGSLQEFIGKNSMRLTGFLKEIKDFENSLKSERILILSKLRNLKSGLSETDTINAETYENQLFDLSVRYDSLLKVIKSDHPKYFNIEYETSLLSSSDIQSKLENHTTLLEYFVSDSTALAFVITKNNFQVTELSGKQLKSNIDELRTIIEDKNLDLFKEKSHELYNILVAPIENQLAGSNLIIVPDGPLWHLNFDLLLTAKNESNNPKSLPYLLRNYAISYANSANYLFGGTEADKSIGTDCLAFSYSDSLNVETSQNIRLSTLRDSKKDLPGSRKEIMEIASFVDGDYFYGSSASEANFKAKSENYGILHLALHGDVDSKTPENSKLYFTKSKDSIEDNFLYSHEIFAMNLPAELTVLSACSSGTGEIIAGEGMMSLGNAFQYAGSKSLLMTQWEISDQVTPELMKLFYTNLKSGMDKSRALQQAKLTYLENADNYRSAPFYWGSFYLVGDTTPIAFKSSNTWIYFILALLAIVLGIYLLRRRHLANN